ncbi:trans-sulfuration enzyme family protein [Flavilitoribacter nigricans]|uniref:trans-sulfuration enzyme family protein n=1 Tax=Flavilitoribacter nigricans TaxID=70997 RepID=UPI001C9E5384|nr:aminotransferase class V-fold PLP-dependent enzyme [Flavilitoribacter nigricans]
MNLRTLAIHGGEADDKPNAPTISDISMATAFKLEADTGFSIDDQNGPEAQPYVYTRWDNPSIDRLAKKLARLEGAERCLVFSSGMAAISTLLFQILNPGDHLVMSDVAYAGASELVNELLGKLQVRISRVNMSDHVAVDAAIQEDTRLVYIETPCNPICRLTDIRLVADIAHRRGALLAMDATFSTPVATRPITLGADLVIHSLTKYIGGHGDAVGGALLGRADLLHPVHAASVRMGGRNQSVQRLAH